MFFLLFYLAALAGLGSYLFWPEPHQAPLRVTRAGLAPSGDRILLEGEGFSASTQVSLALDVSNRRFLRHIVPTWGPGGDLVRVGRLAYATKRDMGLLILDLTEPERPRVVATLRLPGRASTLTVEAGVAYVACGQAGVVLVDVSDPSAPRLLAALPELGMTQGLAVGDGRLYATLFAANVAAALAVADVSDPGQPRIIGRMPLPGQPLGVALGRDGLLIAAAKEGLLEVELGAGLPRLRSSLPLPGSAQTVRVVGKHAFVACSSGGLAVVEWTAGPPRLLAHLPLPGLAYRLLAEGGRIYISDGSGGGKVVDIEDPGQPRLLGEFSVARGASGIAALGTTVYLNTMFRGIQVFDLAEPTPWQSVAQVDLGGRPTTVNPDQDRLLVTTSSGKLHVLEPLTGASLRPVATLALKGAGHFLQIHQGHAYVSIADHGLEVVDIRNSQAPFPVGFYPFEGNTPGLSRGSSTLALAGDRGVLVDGAWRLWRFETSVPGAGELLPGPEWTEATGEVVMDNHRLYITSHRGARIRPAELQPGGTYDAYAEYPLPAQQINQLELLGPVVVAACGLEGLILVDFTAPEAPRLLAALALPISADQLKLVGTTAYVGATAGGLLEVDLSEPARPQIAALLADTPGMQEFAVAGKHAFLGTGSAGLLVVPLPQILPPLTRSAQAMTLALPPIDTAGHYTLRISDGSQTVTLPGALELGARSFSDKNLPPD